MSNKLTNRFGPLWASLLYFAVAAAWVWASDKFVARAVTDPERFNQLQTYKGWAFVLISGMLLYGLLSYFLKRSERHSAEREENQEKLRHLFQAVEQSPVSVIITDKAGDIEYVNPKFTEVTGYSLAEATGKNPRILKSGNVPPERYAELWDCISRGGTWHGELQNRKKNGELYWESATISPIFDDHQEITHYLAVKEDITERKRVAEDLQASEERLRSLIENAQDLITVVNTDGLIQFQSPSSKALLGYDPEHVISRNVFELIHPDDLLSVKESLKKVLDETNSAISIEFRVRHRDGTWHTLESCGKRLDTESAPQIVVNSRDITERRRLEEQFRQAQKMEAIGLLAGGVAHDFNNMLAVIQGRVSLLEFCPGFTEEHRECTDEIRKAAERAAALTRQLLLFSRRQTLQLRNLDLNEAITGMTKMLRRIVGEDIQMQLHYNPKPLMLRADPGMIDQVLMNLAVNSRDAMPQGGLLLIETSEARFDENHPAASWRGRPGHFARLTVSDTGCGIPLEIQTRIFEPFFTTKEVGKGTGLGLATVFGIVEQHRGWIELESAPGKGTKFHIYLPLVEASPEPVVARSAPVMRGGAESILVVEDDAPLRKMISNLLTFLGYRVLEARTGREALEIWAQNHQTIRLLLTDLVMPDGMSGLDLARRLLGESPKLRVIFCSGYSPEIAGKDADMRDGVNFLAKPFAPEKLAQTVRNCLDRELDTEVFHQPNRVS